MFSCIIPSIGADFSSTLDFNRLIFQAACQRYRQIFLNATFKEKLAVFANSVKAAFATPAPALV